MIGMQVALMCVVLAPVRDTLGTGQINLVLMLLVMADCLLPGTRWPRGMGIGIAAAVKLTPLIFALFFVTGRQWRACAVAIGTFVATGLAGAESGAFISDASSERGERPVLYTVLDTSRRVVGECPMPRLAELFAPLPGVLDVLALKQFDRRQRGPATDRVAAIG